MSDQGLSIFDDQPERPRSGAGASDDKTQVIPAVGKEQGSRPAQQPSSGGGAGTGARPAAPRAQTPTFPTVRRGGYDATAVDTKVRQLVDETGRLSGALTEAERRVGDLEREIAAAREELAETERPSYAGLGGRASSMLRLAEEEAGEIRGTAERDAEEIRSQATRDAQAIRADATREAEDMRMVQLKELDEHRARILADAEQERSLARNEAADVLAAARRESDQLRLAADQESTEMRTSAQRDVEQARAAADREVQEARRTLAVEKERLAREATDHHNTAMAETQRLVAEAEQRASAAEERAAQATAQATQHREQAQKEAEAAAGPGPPRGRAGRGLRAHPVGVDHLDPGRRGRARAGEDPRRGRAVAQAPRRHHRPAGLAGRPGRRLRRRGRGPRRLAQRGGGDARLLRHRCGGRQHGVSGTAPTGGLDETEQPTTEPEPSTVEPSAADGEDLGTPGPPLDHRSPFYLGFFGGLGALVAWWLGTTLLSISSTLMLVVVSLFLAAGLHPAVEALVRRGMRRSWAVVTVIVTFLVVVALFVVAIAPVITDQVANITSSAPGWFDQLQSNDRVRQLNEDYQVIDKTRDYVTGGNFVGSLFGGALGVGLAVLGGLFNAFIIIVLTLYFLASMHATKAALYRLAPASRRERVSQAGRPGALRHRGVRVGGLLRGAGRGALAPSSSCSSSASASTPSRWRSWWRSWT